MANFCLCDATNMPALPSHGSDKTKQEHAMKKVLISLAIAFAAVMSANAQISVGAGYLNQTNTVKAGDSSTKNAYNGFYAGADASYALGYGISFTPGVYYAYVAGKESAIKDLVTADYTRHDLVIPVNFKYGLDIANALGVFVYAGPQFNIGLSSKSTATVAGISSTLDNYGEDGYARRFNMAIGLGAGVDILDLIRINVGYDFGLLNMTKSENVTSHYNTLHVGVAVLF